MRALVVLLATVVSSAPPAKFDRKAWLSDYQSLKEGLERQYSHLAWFGSPEGGVDLPELDRETLAALQRATSDEEAIAVFDRFLARIHDGHLVRRPSAPVPSVGVEPTKVSTFPDAASACAAYGYAPSQRVPFSLPFESLPGFSLRADGLSDAFRSGVIEVNGVKLGLVRIQRFRAQEFVPLCLQAWKSAAARTDAGVTAGDVSRVVDALWLENLAARLARFRADKVSAVLVDLGGNGGGNDLGDWAVRTFSSKPITSAPLLIVPGDAGMPYLQEELRSLNGALAIDGGVNEFSRTALTDALARFEKRAAESAQPMCSMSWVWKERRAWGTSKCTRLMQADFFSGPLGFADAGTYDARVAKTLFWGVASEPTRGSWDGPVFVLVNDGTGSSAEAFASLIRDRGVAKIVGVKTLGAGCGFMNDVDPIVLPKSKLAFSVPNCVRLRDDGTDDVAGVNPDFVVPVVPGESGRVRASKILDAVLLSLRSGERSGEGP
ncbi:MAG: S41 family peptidase [Archangium sp.]